MIVTLDEILEHEDCVFVDWSALNLETTKGNDADKVKEILKRDNVYTIKEITAEIRKFEKQVMKSSDMAKSMFYMGSGNRRKEINRRAKYGPESRRYLKKQLTEIRRISEKKELRINDLRYDLLFNMTKLISEKANLKKDMSYQLGEHDVDKSYHSFTDEKLTATVYWNTLFCENDCCLIAEDRDFIRLLNGVTKMIGSKSFLPNNKIFRDKIKENSFRLYTKNGDKYRMTVSSDNLECYDGLNISAISRSENKEIKKEIALNWHQFNNYSTQPASLAYLS